jgi:hypothetical protein
VIIVEVIVSCKHLLGFEFCATTEVYTAGALTKKQSAVNGAASRAGRFSNSHRVRKRWAD